MAGLAKVLAIRKWLEALVRRLRSQLSGYKSNRIS
jgi:hypothetical protein